jgi:hypothetical protein
MEIVEGHEHRGMLQIRPTWSNLDLAFSARAIRQLVEIAYKNGYVDLDDFCDISQGITKRRSYERAKTSKE